MYKENETLQKISLHVYRHAYRKWEKREIGGVGDEKSIEIYVAAVSHLQKLALSPFYDALANLTNLVIILQNADTIKL